MNTATKLGAYALGLAAVFGGALGAGNVTGPVGTATETGSHGHAEEGGHGGHAAAGSGLPGGLQVSEDGYTLAPRRTTVEAGERTDFSFTINGPDGRPVTGFEPLHGERLHLIIARRDLSGFQHLHPTFAGGVWTVPLTLPEAGVYRFFTDFKPAGAERQYTLGTDITAPGELAPVPLPEPERVARVDGYEVRLAGRLVPGESSELTLSVRRDGEPVTDLQPYLEAYGHLVALRAGDLAYLHVHPDGAPGDGKTAPGPEITFFAQAPSAGAYRLYLDFKHGGEVRTAEFTVHAGDAAAPAGTGGPVEPRPRESGGGHDDGHGHAH
ncbi:hypothetical protein [Actinomadura sp. WMMB 499]|uniref:hypothetical protein n=1 Tax=Actinomadura sp. WMMB 499 TaxID=1219491 RepID=UPI001244561C|nr:hypothetical protein [Actinomadura sp. WMMB 499]QFG23044.1 hypothetical protein F7P10_19890 [Actinomadura sp. WMMB 499]